MVLRHPACILSIGLLIAGLRPLEARVWPRFVSGRSSFSGVGEATAERESRLLRPRATALRLGQGEQTCLAPKNGRTGPWGLGAISAMEPVSGLRGGAATSEESEDDFDALDDDDFDALDDDDFDDGMLDEEDFGEANFIERLKQDWRKTPVITRTFFQVSIGIAMFTAVFNGNEWPSFLLLDWKPTIFKLQLWRLFMPFLYLGPLGLNFLLTAHFSWTYMSQLEKLHYREPHTFVMLLAFGMSSLLLLTLVTGADVNSSYTLGHSLSCFLVMVWSRKFAGTKVNVLDMFELSTELLPYFFVAQTLMMEGVVPWVDLSGLLIGYAWQTLSLKGMLQAPKPLKNLFRNNAFLRAEYARAGKEYGQELPSHDDEDAMPPSEASEEEREEEEEEEGYGGGTPTVEKVSAHAPRRGERVTGLAEGKGAGKSEEEEEEEDEGEEVESEEDESEEEEVTEEEDGSEEEEEEASEEQGWGEQEEEGSDGADGTSSAERESEGEDEQEEEEYGSDAEYEAQSDDGEQGVASGSENDGEEESLFEEEFEDFDEEMDNMLDKFEDEMDVDDFSGSFDVSEEEGSFEG